MAPAGRLTVATLGLAGFALAAVAARGADAPSLVRVTDFGASPDSRANAVPAVARALEACRKVERPVLVFPKGRYDFWPQHATERDYFESNTTDVNPKRLAILVEGFAGLVIDGSGSTFVFHDRMQPFTVDHSSSVTIRDLAVDWDVPLGAEAVVEAAAEDHLDLRLDDRQYPYVIENGKLVFVGEGWKNAWRDAMEFDGRTLEVVPGTGDSGCLGRGWRDYRAEEVAPGLVRLHHPFGRRPAVGHVLVLRHGERDHAGLFVIDSRDVTIENVALHSSAGLGLLAQFTENLTVRGFQAVPSARRRVLSGHDDGVHVSNCRGLVTIERSRFHGLMDDPVNVHGTSVRIVGKPAPDRLLCRFMHEQSTGLGWGHPGDRVGFVEHRSMRTLAEGALVSFEPRDRDTFEVRFREPVPSAVGEGDALENLTWAPDVVIRENEFLSNRARGVLVSTPGKVVIERNHFESSGSAVLIAGDANMWYESGAVRDVLVRGNVFGPACLSSPYQFGEGIVSVFPEIPAPDPAHPFHRNIRIEENEFHPADYPVLYAKSVDGLSFSGNRIVRSTHHAPVHARKATLTFELCRRVRVDGNRFEGDVLGRNVVLDRTSKEELAIGPGQGWTSAAPGAASR